MTDETTKEAIDSMKRAQANMRAVLDRNSELERQLSAAVSLCERLIKKHVSDEAFIKLYNRDPQPARHYFTAELDEIRKHLP